MSQENLDFGARLGTDKEEDDKVRYHSRDSTGIFKTFILKMYRYPRLRKLALFLCKKFEKDFLFSDISREILHRFHNVEVGQYSYGPILKLGVLPRGTVVGRYCSVGGELLVFRRNHPAHRPSLHPFFYSASLGYVSADTIPLNEDNPLTIGNDVWIGMRVTILPGCTTIGNGAIIGAGAVVARDVAPYSIVGGVPAKLIRMRFDQPTIYAAEESRWWDLSIEALHNHSKIFARAATKASFIELARRRGPDPADSGKPNTQGQGQSDAQ